MVPVRDNYFAALNCAVFSDGSFVYIPKGCAAPWSCHYFRINAENTGQFERTLIVADEGSHVSYLEGCTAPQRDENQLHAAVVELVALSGAEIKYSTVQNWYPGDEEGRAASITSSPSAAWPTRTRRSPGPRWKRARPSPGSTPAWCSGITPWGVYPCPDPGLAAADTGTKMIHLGKNTRSTIVSKGISAVRSQNAYRGLVRISPTAEGARNYTSATPC